MKNMKSIVRGKEAVLKLKKKEGELHNHWA